MSIALLAQKELTVTMGGIVYDVLLIPRESIVDIDNDKLKITETWDGHRRPDGSEYSDRD